MSEQPRRPPTTPQGAVAQLYEAISFDPGSRPDWPWVRRLFLPEARLLLPRLVAQQGRGVYSRSVEEWIADFEAGRSQWPGKGFYESEIHAEVTVFRAMAHVLSAYVSRFAADEEPFMRGVNSFQLARHEGRWWIAHVLWDIEGEGEALPSQFTGRG